MELKGGRQHQYYRHSTTTPRTLRRVTPIFAERQRSVPRLGDIWVPKLVGLTILSNCIYPVWKICFRLEID
jgi:hypothetical protein